MSKIRQLKAEAKVALPNTGETYVADDGTVSMVLADEHNEDYEPTDEEIREYGEWLGMSFPEDNELKWLAREGLKAPLPKEWKPCKTDTGDVYYFNFKTGDSIWDHPLDEYFKNKLKTEREKLEKKKAGLEVDGALAKLKQRTVFETQQADLGAASKTTSVAAKTISAASSLNNSLSSTTPAASALGGTTNSATVSNTQTTTPSSAAAAAASKVASSASLNNTARTASATKAVAVPIPASVEEVPLDSLMDVKIGKSRTTAAPSVEATPVKQLGSLTGPNKAATSAASATTAIAPLGLGTIKSQQPIAAATLLASPISATSIKSGGALFSSESEQALSTPRGGGVALVSEAEKNMEIKIKSELESEHNEKLAAMASELRDRLARLKKKHEAAVEEARDAHNAAVKRAAREADEEAEMDMLSKKKALDLKYKREIEKLQDDVDDAKAELRRVKAKAALAGGAGSASVVEAVTAAEAKAREQLNEKIESIREEVDSIRERHASVKKEQIAKARQEAEAKLSAVSASAAAAARKAYEERLSTARAQHETTSSKLKAAVEEELTEERERAARAGKGQEEALIEELAQRQNSEVRKIEVNAQDELTMLKEGHAKQLEEMKNRMREELAAAEAAGGGGGVATEGTSAALAAVDEDKKARIESLRARHAIELSEERARMLREREQIIAEAVASASSSANNTSECDPDTAIAAIRAEIASRTRSKIAALDAEHTAEARRLRDKLLLLQREKASSVSSAIEVANTNAANLKLKTFAEQTLSKRDEERREWQLQKDAIMRQIQIQEAAARAAASASQSAALGPAKHAALLNVRQEHEAFLAEQQKKARTRAAEQRQMLQSISQETAELEAKHKLSAVEAEMKADAARKREELTLRLTSITTRSPSGDVTREREGGGGLTDADDQDDDDHNVSPAESDDEAAVLASMGVVSALPDVDVEVRRRVSILVAEYEAKEAALRASFAASGATNNRISSGPVNAQIMGTTNPLTLSRSSTPAGSHSYNPPPTVVGGVGGVQHTLYGAQQQQQRPSTTSLSASSFSGAGGAVGTIANGSFSRSQIGMEPPLISTSADPIALRVAAEQSEMAARREAVAEARRQWEIEMGITQQGQTNVHRQNVPPHQGGHRYQSPTSFMSGSGGSGGVRPSPTSGLQVGGGAGVGGEGSMVPALYYNSTPSPTNQSHLLSHHQHQQPTAGGGGGVDPSLVAVLLSLNNKLDTMNKRIDAIQQQSGEGSPSRRRGRASGGGDERTSSRSRRDGRGDHHNTRHHHHAGERHAGASPARNTRRTQSTSHHRDPSTVMMTVSSSSGRNANPLKETLAQFLNEGRGGPL